MLKEIIEVIKDLGGWVFFLAAYIMAIYFAANWVTKI